MANAAKNQLLNHVRYKLLPLSLTKNSVNIMTSVATAVSPQSQKNNPYYQDEINYDCKSALGKIYQQVIKNEDKKSVENSFRLLKNSDKHFMYRKICEYVWKHGIVMKKWAKLHIFDDKSRFYSVVLNSISCKYNALTKAERKLARENVYRLAGEPPTSDRPSKWGRLHAIENLPRLADAMESNDRININPIDPIDIKKIDIKNVRIKLDKAFNRFKSHPGYLELLQKKVFSDDADMKKFFEDAIFEGTCESQAEELCRLSDVHPTWGRWELLRNVKLENVFYTQIIMFAKNKIGKNIENNKKTYSKNEIQKLETLIELLQTELPYQKAKSEIFKADSGYANYEKIFENFIKEQIYQHSRDTLYGRVTINNIGSKQVNHAIFFQYFKNKDIFRSYDINTGFHEYFSKSPFLLKLIREITSNYGDSSNVHFSFDTNEVEYPCKCSFGQLYQLIIKNKDQKELKDKFSTLSLADQSLVYEMICKYAGHSVTNDLQWGEDHIFDSLPIFRTAVSNAILTKHRRSKNADLDTIAMHIYDLAGKPNTVSPKMWGGIHLSENLPRLADAMEMLSISP